VQLLQPLTNAIEWLIANDLTNASGQNDRLPLYRLDLVMKTNDIN
jgi:hypothetical protein